MRRIVIFADGTWNSPEQGDPSNVLKMSRSVKPADSKGTEQVVFYDWGVGTDRKKMMGGAAGEGINKNIMDCYRFIVHNYKPGDELFFFGFSRGAYTVRSLSGFIRNCGILKRENAHMIPDGYKLYRNRAPSKSVSSDQSKAFRSKYSIKEPGTTATKEVPTPVKFLGVWDTVGALGVPIPLIGTLGEEQYVFHDTTPSSINRHIRHAVSIDENRKYFEHTPVTPKEGVDLKEVWFPGVHADVGGGYRETGLSDAACDWMRKEASSIGIQFEPHMKKAFAIDHMDKAHNERKGFYRVEREVVREVTGAIHVSAKEKFINDPIYQKRSKALKRLLEKHDGDWSKIKTVT